MKYVLAAIFAGAFFNASSINGQPWNLGTIAAVVIMGIWLKKTIDEHFARLYESKQISTDNENEIKDA